MIVTRKEAREIARGQLEEVHVTDPPFPEKGDIEAVLWSATQPPECEVRVLETWPHQDGGEVVRFALIEYDTPRFLHRQSQKGYTSLAHKALEPVEVPKGYVERRAPLNAAQQRLLNMAERESLTLGAQLDAYLADARESRQDVHDRVRKIKREIELLKRDLEQEAA